MMRAPAFLGSFRLSDTRLLLACLGIGFAVRLVPELLAWPLPIGSDTVYYAVVMKSGVVWAHWSQFFTSTWLLNALIVPTYSVLQGDPFLLLKIVAPLLFGLNVAGVYWFARKALGWSMKLSVVAGVFFALQLASLRISWDLLRNTLGLGVLMFALSYSKELGSKGGFALFASLSLLSVFAHEYAAVLLVVAVLGLAVTDLVKKRFGAGSWRLVFASVPALAVFALGWGLRFFPIRYETAASNVIMAGDTVSAKVGGLSFMVNYLQVQEPVDAYGSYSSLVWNVALLFTVLFVPYLILTVKGFFRNGILNSWTVMLLVGAFGCLAVPFFALQYWHRWMFMLVYPFTFYAVLGLSRLVGGFRESGWGVSSFFRGKGARAMVALTLALGFSYLLTPVFLTYGNTSLPTLTGTYRYFPTAPNVPYEDVEGVEQAMDWLDRNMDSNSDVILQHTFVMWGRLLLDRSHTIVSFENRVDSALSTTAEHGFTRAYFVWWNIPLGWYDVTVPDEFRSVIDFGRISVYTYEGEL